MTRRRRKRSEKERRHSREVTTLGGRRLAAGAGVTVGATLLMGGVADATTFTVDTLGDPGPVGTTSLRQAINAINGGTVDPHITFASTLTGTINLNSRLTDFYPVKIEGPGADRITISGQDTSRILYLEPAFPAGIDVTVSGLTFAHGHAEGSQNNRLGAGIFAYNTNLTVSNMVFSQNTAAGDGSGSSGFGGAICVCAHPGGSLTILNSTLSGNTATTSGGGIYNDYAPLTIRNSTINGNSAHSQGGGISVYNGSPVAIENSTITANTLSDPSGTGGGIYSDVRSSGFTLKGVTVTGNSAGHGGGVFDRVNEGAPIAIQDSIVAGNTASVDNPDLAGAFNAAFSLIQTPGGAAVNQAIPGSIIAGQDPQLGPLASNGGPTQTMKPALSSPVIDKGAAFGLTSDQRGAPRPFNVPSIPNSGAPGADGSDIGAVELQASDFPRKCKKKHKKHKKRLAGSAKKKHKKHGCKKKKKKH